MRGQQNTKNWKRLGKTTDHSLGIIPKRRKVSNEVELFLLKGDEHERTISERPSPMAVDTLLQFLQKLLRKLSKHLDSQ